MQHHRYFIATQMRNFARVFYKPKLNEENNYNLNGVVANLNSKRNGQKRCHKC